MLVSLSYKCKYYIMCDRKLQYQSMPQERIEAVKLPEVESDVAQIAANFPYAVAQEQDIVARVVTLGHGQSLDVIDVFLAQKFSEDPRTNKPGVSPGYLTYVGGSFPSRNFFSGAVRAMHMDATLAIIPFSGKRPPERLQGIGPENAFDYQVTYPEGDPSSDGSNGSAGFVRKLRAYPVPVYTIHTGTLEVNYPRRDERKIQALINLPFTDFQETIFTGTYLGRPMAGAFVLNDDHPDPNFAIADDQKTAQKEAILSLVTSISQHQEKIKIQLLHKIKGVLAEQGLEPLDGDSLEEVLIFIRDSYGIDTLSQIVTKVRRRFISQEYIKYYRQKEIAYYKAKEAHQRRTNGVAATVGDQDESRPEYENDPMWNKKRMLKKYMDRLKESKFYINYGADVELILPLVAQSQDYVPVRTSGAVIAAGRIIREGLNIALFNMGYGSANLPLEERLIVIEETLRDPSITLSGKHRFLTELDGQLTRLFGELTGLGGDTIRRAWHESLQTPYAILKDMESGGSPELVQIHLIRNEVRKGGLGRLFLLAYKVDMKDNGDERNKLAFASMWQLYTFLVSTWELPIYEEKARIMNHPVALAISEYFGPAIERQMTLYDDAGEPYYQQALYRTDPISRTPVIVDDKFFKSYPSAHRKGKREPFPGIADYDSTNIVIPDVIYNEDGEPVPQPLTPQERIAACRKMVGGFKNFLVQQYPNCKIEIPRTKVKDTLDNYKRAVSGKPIKDRYKLGEGSIANRILRIKVYIKLTNPEGQVYHYEMGFYPFEHFNENGLMGFWEKRADDPRYRGDRMLERPDEPVGEPSVYERQFPGGEYGWQSRLIQDTMVKI